MTQNQTESTQLLENTKLTFIGCGVMGESIVAGLLRKHLVTAEQVSASHPRQQRRDELAGKYEIKVFEQNSEAVRSLPDEDAIVVLCVKPQRLKGVLKELRNAVKSNQVVISIIAGATIETISEILENKLVVRTMPNTPSQIGAGMTAGPARKKFRNTETTSKTFVERFRS